MSQDEQGYHGDHEPKSNPRIRRGSKGTFTEQGMTRGKPRGGIDHCEGNMVYLTDQRAEGTLRASHPLSFCACITVREVLTQEDMLVLRTLRSPAEFAESKLWARPSLTKTHFDYCRVNIVYARGRHLSRRVCITVREVLTRERYVGAADIVEFCWMC